MGKRNRLRLCPIIVSVLVFALDGPSSGRAADSDPSIVKDLETATTSASELQRTVTPGGELGSQEAEWQRPEMGPMRGGRGRGAGTQETSTGAGQAGIGMGTMMEAMRRPKSTELFPSLINLPDPSPEDLARIDRAATVRMSSGAALLSRSVEALATAARTDDVAAMDKAVAGAREGLSQYSSGLAARNALAAGVSPPTVALGWFKTELGLATPPALGPRAALWIMTPLQVFICTLMTLSIGTFIAIYFMKMKRATVLLQRLVEGSLPEASGAVAAQPDTAAASAMPEISEGLIPAIKRKLCRLRVSRIFQQTPDVKTFRLVSCDRGPIPFSYFPGQFLTLTLPTDGGEIQRSYTIASAPTQAYFCEITVKREDKGAGSRYLHDVVREGQTLRARVPSGRFIFTGKEADSIVLISGGVGITPTMSITRALTDMGWPGDIYFIHAARDPSHFIFASELARLEDHHPNLHLFVAFSEFEREIPGSYRGLITKERISQWVPDITSKWVHLCGSPPMMNAVKAILAELGVPEENVHLENFGSAQKPRAQSAEVEANAAVAPASWVGATVAFQISGNSTQFKPDETVLGAAERIGVNIDYSCRVGFCGQCRSKLLSGSVTMDVEDGLEPGEKDAGMVLACQAKSTSDIVVEA